MKYQILFFLKNNEKILKTVICCSCDWCLKSDGLPKFREYTMILENVLVRSLPDRVEGQGYIIFIRQ